MVHKLEHSNQILKQHHADTQCVSEFCTLHNMSNHSLRHLVQHWNGAYMERLDLENELIYPDPDDPNAPFIPNAVRCMVCKEVLYSRTRHEFVSCSGGHVFVDGGGEYRRFGYDVSKNMKPIRKWPVPFN